MSDTKSVKLSQLLMAAGFKVSEFCGGNDPKKIVVDLFAHFSFPRPEKQDDYYGDWNGYPGFAIGFPGFGMKTDKDGEPVVVEYRSEDGETFPNIVVWSNINWEDGEKITLEDAAHSNYEADTEQPKPEGGA